MTKIKFQEDIVREIQQDFKNRQEMRRPLELIWRLNMNFLAGNQYSFITPRGDIDEYGKQYFWQCKEVFNHIASIIETRLSKLNNVNKSISVRPVSNDKNDTEAAKFSTRVINTVCNDNRIDSLINKANIWSETCGTVFYKVLWNENRGLMIGLNHKKEAVFSGDVEVVVCSPFEIYPDDLNTNNLADCGSIIHAKAYTVSDIRKTFGVDVEPTPLDVSGFDNSLTLGGLGYSGATPSFKNTLRQDCALVIEKYIKSDREYPEGRHIIIAGDKLIYEGALINGIYPFVKQVCIEQVDKFFGASVIERIIPIQRAYNAIKNKKHEMLNRIAMGILAVEDGSVDIDNLEEEGLSPGKILMYRQGSNPPVMLNMGSIPADFMREEQTLLNEFTMVSGVSDITKFSDIPANMTSGVAISLLIEQDDSRLITSGNSIRAAMKEIGLRILELYKAKGTTLRLVRIAGESGEIELKYFKESDISSDNIMLDTENDVINSPSSRKNMVYELLKLGLLYDENGKLSETNKLKVYEMLGLGNWESSKGLEQLHLNKAMKENLSLAKNALDISEFDNHSIHIAEHIRLLISGDLMDKDNIKNIEEHIKQHKAMININDINNNK